MAGPRWRPLQIDVEGVRTEDLRDPDFFPFGLEIVLANEQHSRQYIDWANRNTSRDMMHFLTSRMNASVVEQLIGALHKQNPLSYTRFDLHFKRAGK